MRPHIKEPIVCFNLRTFVLGLFATLLVAAAHADGG